ncbi:hypothetical protein A2Z22_00360 [Candidatus Woesebacteria bacterium RBG_16_34_12]|uniref:Uncharacterized protein n=1 Tax=Candidatus Woesebacteria bacterium RBG_16_34_12 TaxID=1802480 RepID=A0A1F7XAR9_9BACT|nr:MAG: hypothetical protein A2Z22_00360 [Candidatus Woesebacteria bacterium RBG_16_34_12]
MSKRKRFLLTSFFLSIGFVVIQYLEEKYRFYSIATLAILSLVLFTWALKESLRLNSSLLTLILPLYFTSAVGFFWFLLPRSIFTQVPIIIFYGFGIYALCLTANIFTVAAIRTIALLRAAKGVGFVITLVTSFLIFDTILSLRVNIFLTVGLIFLFSVPLFLQGFWVVNLENVFSKDNIALTLISGLVMGELAISIYFWPVTVVVGSLFLTVTAYVLLGLGQARLEERLFVQTVREYLLLGALVFLGMFLATSWGG